MEAQAYSARPPSAGSGWQHFLYVTRALTTTEFKLRYFGSVLGYLWTLLRPLMLFGVLYVVFTHIVRFGDEVPHYPVVLLAAIVVFNFFSEATSGGLMSLVARENLLRKVSFPRAAVPISVSMTAAANLALGILVVFVFAIIDGVEPGFGWIGFLASVLGVVVFATALSVLLSVLYVRYRDMQPIWEVVLQLMFWGTPIIYTIESVPENFQEIVMMNPLAVLLSVLYVRYRDMQPIWEVVLQLMFWGTPIIYTIESVPEDFQEIIMMNPLAVLIQQGRHWLVPSSTESASQAVGEPALLLVPFALFVGVAALSVWTFRRAEGRLAEEL